MFRQIHLHPVSLRFFLITFLFSPPEVSAIHPKLQSVCYNKTAEGANEGCVYLLHLLHDLILPLVFGDGAHEEAAVIQTHTDADELPQTDLVVVQHLDGSLSCLSGSQSVITNNLLIVMNHSLPRTLP